MKIATGLILLITWTTETLAISKLTSLDIDIHACKPEYLKNQVRYICNSEGMVTCQPGWVKTNDVDDLYPCITPECNPECVNGECVAPSVCACEIGWEGHICDECIDLPGCVHGSCSNTGLGCTCDNGYTGGFCDQPTCAECVNGYCVAPDVCKCKMGWMGTACDTCVTLPGCDQGSCERGMEVVPNGCLCTPEDEFEGAFCDIPKCNPVCNENNGECVRNDQLSPPQNVCKCEVGWQGDECSDCVPYPGCPSSTGMTPGIATCSQPNECDCSSIPASDKNEFCEIHLLST